MHYKVETLVFYSKFTFDRNHIAKRSRTQIQEVIDKYASDGWTLASTDAASFGTAM